MICGKNRAFLYPTKVLADTNKKIHTQRLFMDIADRIAMLL